MKERNLNIEAIRILSMLLIVAGHIGGGYIPLIISGSQPLHSLVPKLTFFVTFHVNLFVLISGYCGIRRLGAVVKLWKLIVSWLAVIALLNVAMRWGEFDYSTLLFSLTGNPWWFMRVYLVMALIAPVLIEPALERLDRRGRNVLLAVFLIIDVYIGHFRGMETISYAGYNPIHFVTIYIVGSWLRRFDLRNISWHGRRLRARHYFAMFAAAMVLKTIVHFSLEAIGIDDRSWDYDAAFNILLAVIMFTAFVNLDIQRRWVLWVSSSVVGVYLFHEHPLVSQWLKGIFDRLTAACGGNFAMELAMIAAFIAALFVAGIVIDKLRSRIVALAERGIRGTYHSITNIVCKR